MNPYLTVSLTVDKLRPTLAKSDFDQTNFGQKNLTDFGHLHLANFGETSPEGCGARPTLANSNFGQGLVLLWPISTLASPTLANLKCLVLLWPVLLWPILGQQENGKKNEKNNIKTKK